MAENIVTIDGPSGAGKSTVSQMTAAKLNYTYLDTGAMYRAVGLKIERAGIDLADESLLQALLDGLDLSLVAEGGETKVILDREDVSGAIRTAEMGMIASRVSANHLVRKKLTALQHQLGRNGSVVAEGRDMGTVVFPDAKYKFYLDASAEERARRRCQQLREKGQEVNEREILAQIVKRDQDDSSRALAPLKPASDAIIVDSSKMNADEVVAFMLRYIDEK
ncbi:MAG: (d)CMP kinase [Proteobacteria bacterium]|nr:(d)CMP kinase [Pseudomonadota bacterium]MBU1714673.1 (d)CMP kinase [Pseudomonadota bacterium]